MPNFEIWTHEQGKDPQFLGYQRATNFIEAVGMKVGIEALDKNEDGSIKLTDGKPTLKGVPVLEASPGTAEPASSTAANISQETGTAYNPDLPNGPGNSTFDPTARTLENKEARTDLTDEAAASGDITSLDDLQKKTLDATNSPGVSEQEPAKELEFRKSQAQDSGAANRLNRDLQSEVQYTEPGPGAFDGKKLDIGTADEMSQFPTSSQPEDLKQAPAKNMDTDADLNKEKTPPVDQQQSPAGTGSADNAGEGQPEGNTTNS
jgi:hypothetical protein